VYCVIVGNHVDNPRLASVALLTNSWMCTSQRRCC